MIDKDVLLPDSIFDSDAPPEMKVQLFDYNVAGYNSKRKQFQLTYCKYHIGKTRNMWTVDAEAK